MKNFKSFEAEKYSAAAYRKIEEGIYCTKNPYGKDMIYVTSLTFEQEPELYGEEGGCPQHITQIPFENILDEFFVYVTDFYEQLNSQSKSVCYQEFGSPHLEDIQKLRTMIGKRIYAVPYEEDGEEYYNTVIE